MSVSTISPANASATPAYSTGGRTTKAHGQIVHLAPSNGMLLNVTAVSEMLGCSPRHVYRLSDAGRMPAPVKLGSLVRWSASAIRDWMSSTV